MIEYRSIAKTFPEGAGAPGDVSWCLASRTTTVFGGSSGRGATTLLRGAPSWSSLRRIGSA